MSGRALRKLRQERETLALAADDDDDDESEEEDVSPVRSKKPGFSMMNDSDSSSSSSESDEEESEKDQEKEHPKQVKQETQHQEERKEENLDEILDEFKQEDDKKQSIMPSGDGTNTIDMEARTHFHILAKNIDIRDLDVDHVMRTSLLSAEPASGGQVPSLETFLKSKRKRQIFLFGTPANLDLNVKPPHYVGGGIGMASYDEQSEDKKRPIPWPYSDSNELSLPAFVQDRKRWYTFIHSDSYDRDYQDFKRIQEMGDLNALVLFVAHHPFVAEALMYLGLMLYQVNEGQSGLSFLRRCIWVYESATLMSFVTRCIGGQCFLDYESPENKTYFDALFRLARVNDMSGLQRASLAISRFIISLDPLRDPTGTLLVLDHYALATNLDVNDQWLVELVESQKVRVYYLDESSGKNYQCDLLDLPNWAYSYALALYRVNDSCPNDRANEALRKAISKFPTIIDLLLTENNIDVNSRSCRLDWQAVMDYTGSRANAIHGSAATAEMDPVVRMATDNAYDLMSRVFATLNCKHWSGDAVLIWVHSTLAELKQSNDPTNGEGGGMEVEPLSPALMRYSRIDPADYETKFQLLPVDVNPLDLGLVQHALVIDPNRRRFLRNQRRGQRDDADAADNLFMMFGQDNAVAQELIDMLAPNDEDVIVDQFRELMRNHHG